MGVFRDFGKGVVHESIGIEEVGKAAVGERVTSRDCDADKDLLNPD